jgi:hypothetical protein
MPHRSNALLLSIGGETENAVSGDCGAEVTLRVGEESAVIRVPLEEEPAHDAAPTREAGPHGTGPADLAATGASGVLGGHALEVEWQKNSWTRFGPDLSVILRNRMSRPSEVFAELEFEGCGRHWSDPDNETAEYYRCRVGRRRQAVPLDALGWNALVFSLGRDAKSPPRRCTAVLTLRPLDGGDVREVMAVRIPVGSREE